MDVRRLHPGWLLGGLTIAVCGCAVAVSATSSSGPAAGATGTTAAVESTVAAVEDSTVAVPTTVTTVAPAPTEAPATEAPTTTAVAEPTTTPGPTLPPGAVPVAAMDVAIPALGASDGADTQRLQQRLLDLGFWLQASDGTYGLTTRQAVMAFQKYSGIAATGEVDYVTAAFLTQSTLRARAGTASGNLVEVDKKRQILFIVHDGMTVWVLNASTGNDQPYEEPDQNDPGEIQRGVAITPEGWFKVDRERPEGWWEGDLGKIYRPKYFKGGIAVHGSNKVPNYAASHGCVRVSVPAMDYIWDTDLIPMRTPVWVHS